MPIYHLDVTRSNRPFCNKWWYLAAVAVTIGAILIILSVSITKISTDYDYGIIFDAGSSHTDMFIYKWPSSKLNDTGEVHEVIVKECSKQGISEYASNLEKVENTILVCLEKAKTIIPSDHHERVPVFLGATAGMRLLEAFNKTQSDAVFNKVKESAEKFSFKFKDAKIISGEEEGAGAWMTVNYILGNLIKHSHTVGAMDLGGASTQIAFQPLRTLSEADKRMTLHLFGENYPLYAHSFLCYGKNEIEKRYMAMLVKNFGTDQSEVHDPCAPINSNYTKKASQLFEHVCTSSKYAKHAWGSDLSPAEAIDPNKEYIFQGTSNVAECEDLVNKMFNFTCSYSSCSYNNVYLPKVEGKFMAFSAFYHVMNFFNQTTVKNINNLIETLKNYCSKTWDEVVKINEGAQTLKSYCFDGWYIKDMLTDGYGFNETTWQNIDFQKKVNGQSTGWTTGIMLNLTNSIPAHHAEPSITGSPTFLPLIICGAIIVVIAIIFAALAFYTYRSQNE